MVFENLSSSNFAENACMHTSKGRYAASQLILLKSEIKKIAYIHTLRTCVKRFLGVCVKLFFNFVAVF